MMWQKTDRARTGLPAPLGAALRRLGALAACAVFCGPSLTLAQEPDPEPKHTVQAGEPAKRAAQKADDAHQRRRKQTAARIAQVRADREALRTLIDDHVAHANAGDVEAYMGDFVTRRRNDERIRAYAERVLEEHRPTITVESFELVKLSRSTARIEVIQSTDYVDARGRNVRVRTFVTYRARKLKEGWRIDSTRRRRLVDGDTEWSGEVPIPTDAPQESSSDEASIFLD